MTTTPAPRLEELTAAEALRLMAGVPVGRVVFTEGALPAIRPVHFFVEGGRDAGPAAGPEAPADAADGADQTDQADPATSATLAATAIVFRVIGDRNLASALHRSVVAFQADECDMERRSGWSVTATGNAVRVDDAAEIDRLSRRLPIPWAEQGIVFRIEPELVTGRRLNR
ncbi:pyridoxamine 5'-phosphate oxidase family protein [Streptodolium elevatio]|uniref:Pyridoxamine 5'-phosphate oxidase family protein n=1 Tax=Streptodolium elevatio TaxID=3157996 RepID=A0ABV3DID4_9ACTN